MKINRLLDHVWIRNLMGLAVLLAVHLLADIYAIGRRPGLTKVTPYFYLVLLYGWLVFHNRILFEGLFLRGRKTAYFGWLLLLVAFSSFNMNFILHTEFGISRSLPYIVSFWVYTVTGLGVYITYKYLRSLNQPATPASPPATLDTVQPVTSGPAPEEPASFLCMVDGERLDIAYPDILYIESLENYLKIFTKTKPYIIRLTLKEAEARLPRRLFVRISRSHIVNLTHATRADQDTVKVGEKELRIGKVYKRHVLEQLPG
ncbi:hypothetical protein GCM10023189_58040 [Nibrella saemangeumensis]|uniref:HTH LytTR-type domain-containing protein n=1 Tax=Nibrella saemangeumensis TaxID=1084526 RepID=A0ABP8NN63_9BACT